MAATITAIGTWTSIAGATGQDAKLNVPSINKMDFEALKGSSLFGVVLPELRDFITAAQVGWGLNFWQAAGLMEVFMRALMNSQGPTQQTSYTP